MKIGMQLKKTVVATGLAAIAALSTGCASSGLVGTWKSANKAEGEAAAAFDFASVTFAPDGTYTAEMLYGGKTFAQTGTWDHTDGKLTIGPDPVRAYGVTMDGADALTFDGGRAGSVNMRRYRP